MRELVEVINHISLLPSVRFDSNLYEQILERKVIDLSKNNNIDSELLFNIERILSILPKIRTLPPELSHLLFNIETICMDIVDYIENNTSETELMKKIQKNRLIIEKIDRVLYTYIAEDPKRYLKYSIIIRDIYDRLTTIFELIKEKQKLG